jgi:hypothetical protein
MIPKTTRINNAFLCSQKDLKILALRTCTRARSWGDLLVKIITKQLPLIDLFKGSLKILQRLS